MIEIGPADDGAVCMNEACCMYAHPCPEDCKIHDAGGGNPPVPAAVMNISMGPTDDDSHNRCERCAGKMLVGLVKTTFVSGGSETIIVMSDADAGDDSESGVDEEDIENV